jgi:pimeloyl-ACP methyl ester carboxylesterase
MFEKAAEAMGFEALFEQSFGRHVDLAIIPEAERRQYIAEWSQPGALTAMLNWYRASKVKVPPPRVTLPVPQWLLGAFPKVEIPTLVIWGMRDKALLPVQLDGLDRVVEDLRVVRLPDAGHFAPWEAPEPVVAALRPFLAARSEARAAST